jgi:alkylation response protein AidB-like acyl-CoA dehydrogenase
MSNASEDMESVEEFTQRARRWLVANMPPFPLSQSAFVSGPSTRPDEEELARIARCRELQQMLFAGGLAGICVPRQYGGQGLTMAHQEALNREIVGYDYPMETQVPTFTPCMAVLLEFGTEEQKQQHVPAMLRGEEIWMQLLSEPSGGSDVAGAQTSAVRDGNEWVVNGSKIWTTGAWWADWGLLLARTNWDIPKHRGLSVFMLRMRQPGIEIHRIEMLSGSKEFCQEFITDLRVPDSDRIGEVDQGWTVGTRWMYHERTVSGGSPYITRPAGPRSGRGPQSGARTLAQRIATAHHLDLARRLELVGEFRAIELVEAALSSRIGEGIRTGRMTDQSAAITRLYAGARGVRVTTIGFELGGAAAVAWSSDEDELGQSGIGFLMRQSSCIGGGTTEMSRNVVSERVLGMPRERTLDRDVPFRDVPRGPS